MSECGLGSPQWSCDHANRRHSLFLLAILERGSYFGEIIVESSFSDKASVVTMSSQDKVKKGQRKSAFCGHFMTEWDDHHYCPKDDLKGDDPCVNSSDCTSFSDEHKSKIATNSSAFVKNGGTRIILQFLFLLLHQLLKKVGL